MKDDRPNVYAVSRSVWGDPDFANEPYTEREAWLWLIGAAVWKDVRTRGTYGPVNLKRGEFSHSVRFLAERWQWSKSKVDRFISSLEKRDMLRDTSRDSSKVYSIKNYSKFQVVGLPKRDSDQDDLRDTTGTVAGQLRDKEETGETGKQVKEDTSLRSVAREPKQKFTPPSWIPEPQWTAFLEMRKRLHAPMTNHAMELTIAKLDRFRLNGHDPGAVLDRSVERGWRGVFEIKSEDSNGSGGYKNGKSGASVSHQAFLAGGLLALAGSGSESENVGRPANTPRLIAKAG